MAIIVDFTVTAIQLQITLQTSKVFWTVFSTRTCSNLL